MQLGTVSFFLRDVVHEPQGEKKIEKQKHSLLFHSQGPPALGTRAFRGGNQERLPCGRFLDPQRPLVSGSQGVDRVFLFMASFDIGELSALWGCTAFPWESGTWGNKGKGSLCFVLKWGLRCWEESRFGELGRPGLDQLCSGCVSFRWCLSEPQSHRL